MLKPGQKFEVVEGKAKKNDLVYNIFTMRIFKVDDDAFGGVWVNNYDDFIEHDHYRIIKLVDDSPKYSTKKFLPITRKEVIEYAKLDLEEIPKMKNLHVIKTINGVQKGTPFSHEFDEIVFNVDNEKRIVKVTVRTKKNKSVYGEAYARFDNDEVFNIHIGKALAICRLFGVPIPDYYLNTPQPKKFAIGQVIQFNDGGYYDGFKGEVLNINGDLLYIRLENGRELSVPNHCVKIFDDSEVVYEK
jgi:hypothetical protein